MRTVIRTGVALTMDPDLGVIEEPEITIEGQHIISVRSRTCDDPGPPPEGADLDEDVWELDLPDRVVLPGFVNAHTHAGMTLMRGFADDMPLKEWLEERIWPAERHVDEDDVHAGTLLAAAEMLAGGVTTFADMYIHMDGAAQAVEEAGARAVLGPGLFSALGPVEESVERVADFHDRWDGAADGRIRVVFAPHAVYTCTPELLREAADAARERGTGCHIHLSETRFEVESAREEHGMSPVALAAETGVLETACVAAHCVWVTADDVRLLRDAGAGVAHNPRSNMKLASGIAPVGDLLGAGIPVGLGTDGAASTNQLTMLEEMRAACLLQKVSREDPTALPAEAVLEMATIGGARALRLDDEVGSLTPGKRADLLTLRLDRPGTTPVHDPFSAVVYSAQDQDVEWVFCDGTAVAHDGRPLEFELPPVREDVLTRARAIVERVGP